MTIEVREATPEEHAEAGAVTADAYREFIGPGDDDWERYLARIADVRSRADRTMVLVAVEDDHVLGSLTLELEGRVRDEDEEEFRPLDPDEAHIRMLGVGPDARRRGVARSLMAEAERVARTAGKGVITLNTTRRMKAARAMYERLGFQRDEDVVFPDGFVLLGFRKRLA